MEVGKAQRGGAVKGGGDGEHTRILPQTLVARLIGTWSLQRARVSPGTVPPFRRPLPPAESRSDDIQSPNAAFLIPWTRASEGSCVGTAW